MQDQGPLVLGATGRLGRAFRRLWADGFWPGGANPVWHQRGQNDADDRVICWDLLTEGPPDAGPDHDRICAARGVIVLAGVTSGPPEGMTRNTDLALAALDLADRYGLGPVLLCSSAAVYGRSSGPQSEAMPCQPANPYGAAKLAMEVAAIDHPATCLRIANVAGSDQLFVAAARGRVRLDRFPDGRGPERAYIGPVTLARTMLALIDWHHRGHPLPAVVNIAAPAPVRMEDVLTAAGLPFDWTPAPATAFASVTLDTRLLSGIAPVSADSATPANLVAEALAAGWAPA